MPTIGNVEQYQLGVNNREQYTKRLEQYFAAEEAVLSDQYLFNIKSIKSSKASITVDLVMEVKDICMELDTGAALSIQCGNSYF